MAAIQQRKKTYVVVINQVFLFLESPKKTVRLTSYALLSKSSPLQLRIYD